jgi:hypothetical protein
MAPDSAGGRFDAGTAVRGAAVGVGTFLLGYVVTFLTATNAGTSAARAFEPLARAGGRFVPDWKAAGWLFLDSHQVGLQFDGRHLNFVSFAGVEYLILVAPILLVVAGALVARWSASDTRRQGLVDGATVAIGYLVFVAVFATLVQHANVRPRLLRSVVIAGVVYPVVFGGLGGFLAVVASE